MTFGTFTRIGLVTATVLAGFVPAPARAQIGGTSVPGPVAPAAKLNRQRQAAPAALPGASATPAAPANPNAGNLSPDAALFDAIERGDLAATRAALSRGASLSARNLLGQTPLDVAVDLGRNDITFLLLSLRNAQAAG